MAQIVPAGLTGMIGLSELSVMMELAGILIQPSESMIGMLAAAPEVLADLTEITGLMAGMPIATQRLVEMVELAETAELTRAQQAELPRCTALAGRSELVAETGLAAGFALVLVAPAELIESTETLGIPIASPAAPVEPLAEILELVGLLELTTLLIEPVGPVELAVLMAETPTELMVGLLAGLVGHPYSRR